jgi:glucose/arabinose dehydrogenase
MKAKIVIAVLLSGGFLGGVLMLCRQGGGQPPQVAPPLAGSKGNPDRAQTPALTQGMPAPAAALGATTSAATPRLGEVETSVEARQKGYVEHRVAELMELAELYKLSSSYTKGRPTSI